MNDITLPTDRLLKAIMDNTNEGIVLSNSENTIIAVNNAFTEIMGFKPEEIVGKSGSFLRSGKHDDAFYSNLWKTVQEKGIWAGELWVRRKNDEVFSEWLVFTVIKNDKGEITNYLSIFSDITERKTSAERIHFLANFDPLTNLPNYEKLTNQLEAYVQHAKTIQTKVALFYIGLDRFKNVNASLGLLVGDKLLQNVATRLESAFESGGIVARISGDRFIATLPSMTNVDTAASISQKLLTLIQEPMEIEGQPIIITASIGISIYPNDGITTDSLIKNAETAMFQAKKQGRNDYQFFTEDMNASATERLILENKMRQAIDNQEFELFYQPIVSLETGQIKGVEALIRWMPKDAPPVSPGKFIPIAEDAGLIVPITEWVLKTACRENRKWVEAGLTPVPIAVNISSVQFKQKDFKDKIINLLQKYQLDPTHLKLEITEGTLMQDAEGTIKTIVELKSMGMRFSIDDFGTGYSSLSYLKRLPLTDLKIDQSFVRDVVTNADSKAIVLAIISLAKSLKLNLIAEGVETKEQLDFLRDQKCDTIQGYYFSKPVPSKDLMEMLRLDKRLIF